MKLHGAYSHINTITLSLTAEVLYRLVMELCAKGTLAMLMGHHSLPAGCSLLLAPPELLNSAR